MVHKKKSRCYIHLNEKIQALHASQDFFLLSHQEVPRAFTDSGVIMASRKIWEFHVEKEVQENLAEGVIKTRTMENCE